MLNPRHIILPPAYENEHDDSLAEFWFKAAAIACVVAGGFALIL